MKGIASSTSSNTENLHRLPEPLEEGYFTLPLDMPRGDENVGFTLVLVCGIFILCHEGRLVCAELTIHSESGRKILKGL